MSKFKKLFNNPSLYFSDALTKRGFVPRRSPKSYASITYFAIGFSPWKSVLATYFKGVDVLFLPKNITKQQFFGDVIPGIRQNASSRILIWGLKAPDFVLEAVRNLRLPTYFVEDGFIRSIELGSTKTPPLSLCLDEKSPYFDSLRSTTLEDLLQNYDFEASPDLEAESARLISRIQTEQITKYNFLEHKDPNFSYGPKLRKRVLVLGQVPGDASLSFGQTGGMTSLELVRQAVAENPGAQIIYRPHPDDRQLVDQSGDISSIALIADGQMSLPSSLLTVDHVYTLTSLAGLEALIRGIKVTTFGAPFYSNWGLTDDRVHIARRSRNLSITQLMGICYIEYPRYYDPYSGAPSDCNSIIDFIGSAALHWKAPAAEQTLLNDREFYTQWLPTGQPEAPCLYLPESSTSYAESECLRAIAKRADVRLITGDFRLESNDTHISSVIRHGIEIEKIEISRLVLNDGIGGSAVPFEADLIRQPTQPKKSSATNQIVDRLRAAALIQIGRHQDAYDICKRAEDLPASLNPTRIGLDGGIYSSEVLTGIPTLSGLFNQTLSEADVAYALRKAWRVYGVNQITKNLFERAARRSAEFKHDTLMLIAAFMLEAGQRSKAIEFCQRAAHSERAAWKWTRYLAVSHTLFTAGLARDHWAAEDAALFEELTRTAGRFPHLIKQYQASFAVVGNSPAIIGTRSGEDIDRKDLVIRFNSAVRGYPFSLDCGNKIDVLVLNPDFSQTQRSDFGKLELAVISDGDLYSSRNLAAKLSEIKGRCSLQLLDSSIDRRVVSLINSSPSSGLKTLYWIYTVIGPVPREHVFGFSLDDQKPGIATSYSKSEAVRMPIIHSWESERRLFDKILQDEATCE